MDQEHEESWCMRIYNKLLTVWVKLVLLAVNSFKWHSTALKDLNALNLNPISQLKNYTD